jgi:hypothetical protein
VSAGATGQSGDVAQVDAGIAHANQPIAFQIFEDLIQRGALHAQHRRQRALGKRHLPIHGLIEQQTGHLFGQRPAQQGQNPSRAHGQLHLPLPHDPDPGWLLPRGKHHSAAGRRLGVQGGGQRGHVRCGQRARTCPDPRSELPRRPGAPARRSRSDSRQGGAVPARVRPPGSPRCSRLHRVIDRTVQLETVTACRHATRTWQHLSSCASSRHPRSPPGRDGHRVAACRKPASYAVRLSGPSASMRHATQEREGSTLPYAALNNVESCTTNQQVNTMPAQIAGSRGATTQGFKSPLLCQLS